jgi:hypothetical protein
MYITEQMTVFVPPANPAEEDKFLFFALSDNAL